MKRWLKRISITLLVLITLVASVAWVVYRRANRVPAWYAQAKQVDTAGADAAEKQRIIPMQNWVARSSAVKRDTTPPELKQFTTELTADQINALIAKWSEAAGITERLAQHLTNLRIRLADGQITIAGESTEYGKVLSIVLQPRSGAHGYAEMVLDSIQIGDQTLPLVTLEGQKNAIGSNIMAGAPSMHDKIAIDDYGAATRETESVYYSNLVATILSGAPANLYTFLMADPMGKKNPIVTRVKSVTIVDGTLSMTLEMLSAEQRKALVEELKAVATEPITEPIIEPAAVPDN
ncbi:MAG: hypothetical protein H7144_02405 [Burkholderiales bacterium]|nr:hypothetical protein [Phycisphaerae bacterium]